MAAAPGWWRLELASLPELEESLLWKLAELGIPRVAVQHRPETPSQRQLIAWLPAGLLAGWLALSGCLSVCLAG